MDDHAIISLYWARDPQAITESDARYGRYLTALSRNILASAEDAEECVNDTWLRAWNTMPPQKPARLQLFFARITRNLSLNRYKALRAEKRGGGEMDLVLEELEDCLPSAASTEDAVLAQELAALLDHFLKTLPERERFLFLRRYFYAEPIAQAAGRCRIREDHAAVLLSRTRKKLRQFLAKEGYTV